MALAGKDRVIVALDVAAHEDALRLVDALTNVSLFKIGLELFLKGNLVELLTRIQERPNHGGGVFIDLKLSGDIGNTVASLIRQCQDLGAKFLTLSETYPFSATKATIAAARQARRGADPKLLMVPFLSSLDESDLREAGVDSDLTTHIVARGHKMIDAGCDGLIVSGDAIRACRAAFGPDVPLVSPGIRPDWSETNDHKRHTTPSEAIRLGSDYLVVGRPITRDASPRDAAQRIIDEIDEALAETDAQPVTYRSQ